MEAFCWHFSQQRTTNLCLVFPPNANRRTCNDKIFFAWLENSAITEHNFPMMWLISVLMRQQWLIWYTETKWVTNWKSNRKLKAVKRFTKKCTPCGILAARAASGSARLAFHVKLCDHSSPDLKPDRNPFISIHIFHAWILFPLHSESHGPVSESLWPTCCSSVNLSYREMISELCVKWEWKN